MNVGLRPVRTSAEQAALTQFDAASGALPGSPVVDAARREAIRRVDADGLPHRRIEDWKYTDLRAALRELPAPAVPSDAPIDAETLSDVEAWRILIVDGGEPRVPEGLIASGIEVVPLAEALVADEAADLLEGWPAEASSSVLDLNTAFMSTGVVIRVPEGVQADRPIQIASVTTVPEAASIYMRNRIDVGQGASLTVIESHEGPDGVGYIVNAANRMSVGSGASLKWVKVQRDGTSAMHLATSAIDLAEGARLTYAPFTTGAVLSRNQAAIVFGGENAEANVAGVQLLGGRQHGDTTLFVDHALPNGASRELFKSVLDDTARGVFQGKIVVRQDAQKVDGRMMTQSLMLSERAEADAKPELEIYADDVQCGHGATFGRIDEDLMFYLRARGIPETVAKGLLIEAFIGEAIEAIEDEAIGEALSAIAHDWVSGHAAGDGEAAS